MLYACRRKLAVVYFVRVYDRFRRLLVLFSTIVRVVSCVRFFCQRYIYIYNPSLLRAVCRHFHVPSSPCIFTHFSWASSSVNEDLPKSYCTYLCVVPSYVSTSLAWCSCDWSSMCCSFNCQINHCGPGDKSFILYYLFCIIAVSAIGNCVLRLIICYYLLLFSLPWAPVPYYCICYITFFCIPIILRQCWFGPSLTYNTYCYYIYISGHPSFAGHFEMYYYYWDVVWVLFFFYSLSFYHHQKSTAIPVGALWYNY